MHVNMEVFTYPILNLQGSFPSLVSIYIYRYLANYVQKNHFQERDIYIYICYFVCLQYSECLSFSIHVLCFVTTPAGTSIYIVGCFFSLVANVQYKGMRTAGFDSDIYIYRYSE